MFKVLQIFVLLAVSLVLGCAHVEVRPIKKTDDNGIRFYRPWPYLWVTHTIEKDKKGCALTVEYLPDTSQEYIIVPYTGVGSVSMGVTLTQGWNLTAFNSSADSKTAELINSISGLVGNIKKPALAATSAPLRPGLYRFVFDAQGHVSDLADVFHLSERNCIE